MRVTGNFFLVGLMGAGKTTVGRALARALRREFVDSDHEIAARTGVSIPTIFEIEGEDGFRSRETAVLKELAVREGLVVATGGGAVLREENRAVMRDADSRVIYLRADVVDLYERTRHDRNRPLLQVPDPQAKLRELYTQRDPLYREVAHLVVDTGRQNVPTLVKQIIRKLQADT